MISVATITKQWAQRKVLPALEAYVRVPSLSPAFGGHTAELQDSALQVITDWIGAECQDIKGMTHTVLREPNRTPLLFVEVAASSSSTAGLPPVLLYGHFDKQPPFTGWLEGLGPYTPVVKDGKLYGRGAADDGYACFAALTAVAALQAENKPHGRMVLLIEGSEESGSPDLPTYVDKLMAQGKIGAVALVVCLDSGAGSYDRLWVTSSLRGIVMADLTVSVIKEGVHSGDASGVVPSTFRIARSLIARLEDQETGRILPPALYATDLDAARTSAAKTAAEVLGKKGMVDCFPFLPGARPPVDDVGELGLNRWWRPQLEVIGADGFPACAQAGNVLRPSTSFSLSMRLPPTVPTKLAEQTLRDTLVGQPALHGASVTLNVRKSSQGWAAPPTAPWLAAAAEKASVAAFGKPAVYQGEGGSIPFMAMLGQVFPQAQFLVTGVLGPGANAHGPNEFLHLGFVEQITACVANVLSAFVDHHHAAQGSASPDKKTKVDAAGLASEYGRQKDGSKV